MLFKVYKGIIIISLCFIGISCTCGRWIEGGSYNEKPSWAIQKRAPMGCSGVVGCSSHINSNQQIKEATVIALEQLGTQQGVKITGKYSKQTSDINGLIRKIISVEVDSEFKKTVKAIQFAKWSSGGGDMTCVWLKEDW